MPKDMFYNTPIATYIWLLDNNKPAHRKNKVQLIDGTNCFEKLRKNVGSKRVEISPANLEVLVREYDNFEETEVSKLFETTDFGYTTITVEQPLRQSWALTPERIVSALSIKALANLTEGDRLRLEDALAAEAARDSGSTTDAKAFTTRIKNVVDGVLNLSMSSTQLKSVVAALGSRDESAPISTDAKGKPVADAGLRDTENVPLSEDIEEYAAREIAPHVTDFWLDRSKDKVGYEIPFTRYFYKYVPPRPLQEIDNDLNKLIAEITNLLREIEK
jgi:type I restriction enzyme M protein